MTTHKINRLGMQGDGIADGPIYAARTLPGEIVSGILNGQRLSETKVVEPSADRVAAPCRHYKACGGCQLQHASDAFVESWKVEIVRQALAAQDLSAEFRPIVTSASQSRRRAVLSVRRTKKGAMSGFHARSSDVIVEVPDCKLVDLRILESRPFIEQLAEIGASRKAELSVTLTVSKAGLDVAVQGGKPLDGPLLAGLAQLAGQSQIARLSWDDEVIAMIGPPSQNFGLVDVVPPPGAFLQATPEGEASLVKAVCEAVQGASRVVDLFAGCGTFSLPLAEQSEVLAVEGDGEMMRALDQAWRNSSGLKMVQTETRDLFRRPLLPDEFRKFDAVVLDPPRAGAEEQVAQLAMSDVPTIAYVSCNPVTFARDAQMLVKAGFALEWVQVVDQFRWSTHVELAARFHRN